MTGPRKKGRSRGWRWLEHGRKFSANNSTKNPPKVDLRAIGGHLESVLCWGHPPPPHPGLTTPILPDLTPLHGCDRVTGCVAEWGRQNARASPGAQAHVWHGIGGGGGPRRFGRSRGRVSPPPPPPAPQPPVVGASTRPPTAELVAPEVVPNGTGAQGRSAGPTRPLSVLRATQERCPSRPRGGGGGTWVRPPELRKGVARPPAFAPPFSLFNAVQIGDPAPVAAQRGTAGCVRPGPGGSMRSERDDGAGCSRATAGPFG